jgi:hypothetical protein
MAGIYHQPLSAQEGTLNLCMEKVSLKEKGAIIKARKGYNRATAQSGSLNLLLMHFKILHCVICVKKI